MNILGIETSCDETAASVVEDGSIVKSNIIASQINKHAIHGGVVPELAAREHLRALNPVINAAVAEANIGFSDLDAIAVTYSPGLVPALLVGVSYAKGLAAALQIPIKGINHFLAHIYAAFIDCPEVLKKPETYPIVSLVVSGGHTALTLISENGEFRILGRTLDDAAGEAFDKGAKILALSYPGGPLIDHLSKFGDPERFSFPKGLISGNRGRNFIKNRLNFSFSGVKTSLLYHVREHNLVANCQGNSMEGKKINREFGIDPEVLDTIASFQEAIVDALTIKALWAAQDFCAKTLVVCGGVACNSRLRTKLESQTKNLVNKLLIAPPHYCTDNAAMIAGLSFHYDWVKAENELNLDVCSRLDEISSVPFAIM